jgi:hypothetical protein
MELRYRVASAVLGLSLTPNALAVAPVATEAKKLMVIMNATTSIITTKSPYIVRLLQDPCGTFVHTTGAPACAVRRPSCDDSNVNSTNGLKQNF